MISSAVCTRQIVCDNLKAGVTAACRYEPGINRTYQEMAAHYGTAIVPTRVRKPRDKAIGFILHLVLAMTH